MCASHGRKFTEAYLIAKKYKKKGVFLGFFSSFPFHTMSTGFPTVFDILEIAHTSSAAFK